MGTINFLALGETWEEEVPTTEMSKKETTKLLIHFKG